MYLFVGESLIYILAAVEFIEYEYIEVILVQGIYCHLYNMSYIIPEAVLTLILISLPPVKKMLARVRQMAAGSAH